MRVASGASVSSASICTPNGLLKPSICAAAEASVSSAAKKMRARKPIIPPIRVSAAITRRV